MKNKIIIFIAAMISGLMWVTVAAAQEQAIVVGYTGPLSGPAAEYGQDCLNGIEMAVGEINAAGGIVVRGKKYPVRVEKMDDQVNPKLTVTNAEQMLKEHKAVAIFNPIFGTMTALMKMNTAKNNEFILMGYTSVPQAAEMGNKLTIIMTMPFTTYNKVMTSLAWDRGWRKAAIVVTAGAYGDAWRKAFRDEWLKKGGEITVDKATNYYTRTDFAAPLTEALASKPDFMLIGGPSSTTALIIEQARLRGFEGGFMLIDQAKLDAIHNVMEKPLNMEGCIGVAMASSIVYPATEAFVTRYKEQFKRDITWESVVHYTSMHALAKAIALSGRVDQPASIRAAFSGVFPMLGDKYPMEFYGILPNGLTVSTPVIQTMRHAKFSKTDLYVWWAKTRSEFDMVQRTTKGTLPLTWFRMQ